MQLENTEVIEVVDQPIPTVPNDNQPIQENQFQEETPLPAETSDGGKEDEVTEGQTKHKVTNYYWKRYNPLETKEINYISDFLKENEGANILRKKLGLNDINEGEKVAVKKPTAFTFNSSNVRLMDVADNIMNRLVNLGGLDEEKNIIKRKRHNNENYYEQDDFIDDQVEGCRIQQFISKYEDFFSFEGSKEEFMMSPRYHSRMNEINSIAANKKIKLPNEGEGLVDLADNPFPEDADSESFVKEDSEEEGEKKPRVHSESEDDDEDDSEELLREYEKIK